MLSNLLESIKSAKRLQKQSTHLRQLQEASSSSDFDKLLTDFEVEVDRLNALLISQFGDDPDIMQITFELKAAIIALKAGNVEMAPSIS